MSVTKREWEQLKIGSKLKLVDSIFCVIGVDGNELIFKNMDGNNSCEYIVGNWDETEPKLIYLHPRVTDWLNMESDHCQIIPEQPGGVECQL